MLELFIKLVSTGVQRQPQQPVLCRLWQQGLAVVLQEHACRSLAVVWLVRGMLWKLKT